MEPVDWENFPLPLIQVNPPKISDINLNVEAAYKNGVFSNSAEIQMKASQTLAQHVEESYFGYLASNNTMALTACLLSIGVRGKHVIISNFTFAATLDAVILAGGIPIVCDIDPDSLVLSKNSVSEMLNNSKFQIAVVVPTRVFGFVTDLSDLVDLCNQHNVPVVVDAAASFPAKKNVWKYRHVPLFEVFSLHATKVFGIGEGGLVIGGQEAIENVRTRANFGISRDNSSCFLDGLNAKADEFTAARALARFADYPVDVEIRYKFAQLYKSLFLESAAVRTLNDTPETIYSYFPIIFENEKKLISFKDSIDPFLMNRRYYFPTIFNGYRGDAAIIFESSLNQSESIASRILCLPVYVSYTSNAQKQILELLEDTLGNLS